MFKTTITKPTNLSQISIEPLTPEQKKIIVQEAFGDISELSAENIQFFLSQLHIVVKKYLKEYNDNWLRFDKAFNLSNKISTLPADKRTSSEYIRLKNQQGNKKAAEDFIRTLEKGNFLLQYIRTLLTSQTINTNFAIKTNDEIYYVDQKKVNYKIVLSTFGSSGNNFVSLAYKVDVDKTINDLKESILDNTYSIKGTDIYNRIMEVKNGYLQLLKAEALARGKKVYYTPRFDSTDTEIFDLLQQRLKTGDVSSLNRALTVQTYRRMRKTMGGRGGYRTSTTQLGDIGLTQDKLVSQKINQVNFARQTLIYNRFKSLDIALSSTKTTDIKKMFLQLFTEKQSRVEDNLSKMVNREAKEMIQNLFKE